MLIDFPFTVNLHFLGRVGKLMMSLRHQPPENCELIPLTLLGLRVNPSGCLR